MDRREFLKCGSAVCVTLAAGSFLAGCRGTRHLDVAAEGRQLRVPLAELKLQDNSKRRNIILRNPVTAFPVLLRIDGADQYRAFLLRCPHQGAELTVSGDLISCPAHGSEFDAKGKLLQGPAENDLQVLPVKSENDQLLITLT